jgi:murein DD-endopeptidase MepM/ murein hydrolase activator NlpD
VLSAPDFGPSGEVYVVRGAGFGATVFVLAPQRPARRVGLPAIVRELGLSALAVSRDGSRVAMVVGPPGQRALMVAALSTRDRQPRISQPLVLVPSGRDVAGVAWGGASEILTTALAGGRRAVVRTDLDGYRVHAISDAGLLGNPFQVAAAPGQPILATAGGSVWSFSGERWRRVSTGRDPSYAS